MALVALAALGGVATGHAALRRGRVVVVGAGVSGLACARDLMARGFETIVLEARDRIGGRTWTDDRLGVPVDLGASWIVETEGNPLTTLAQAAGLRTVATGESIRAFDADGRRLSEAEITEIGAEFDGILEEVEALADDLDRDISLGEGVRRVLGREPLAADERRALDWAMASMATDSGADFDDMSLLRGDPDEGFDGGDVILPEGYAGIVDYLARGLDLRLGQAATAIRWRGSSVEVSTPGARIDAAHVVVTVPLGVLAAGSITFDPPLPAPTRDAVAGLRMGTLDKAILRFPRVAWPDEENFAYLSERAGEWPTYLNLAPSLGQPLLIAFCAGRYAAAMERRSEAAVRDTLMAILRRMFGSGLPDPVGFLRTRWMADPWSRGSYSFVPLGGDTALRGELARSIGGRLHFAGEATHERYPATVHGAYLSGLRAAATIAGA
jgi:monoamine oxidase